MLGHPPAARSLSLDMHMAARGRGCCSTLRHADPHSKPASALLAGRRDGYRLPRVKSLVAATSSPGSFGFGAQPAKDDGGADGDAEPLVKRVRAVTKFESISQARSEIPLARRGGGG